MHIILQPLTLQHLAVTGFEQEVTTLYGDDGKQIKLVLVDILHGYVYTDNHYYNYRIDGNTVFLWEIGH